MKKIKIGITGAGSFSECFINLFKKHPLVRDVIICDINEQRLKNVAKKFEIPNTLSSHNEMCKSDVDAIAIFTQRHLHSDQTLQALDSGKHVYCAVPMAHTIEDIEKIVRKVEETELIYMTGETSYYYPSTIFCRNQFKEGKFGNFVYGEAQYMHDMSHGFYDAFKNSGGNNWKKVAGFPPMFYPTHSTSMLLSVTNSYPISISCLGYKDSHEDKIFTKEGNLWGNEFSNQTALIRTSDGGMIRINEFRRVGWRGKVAPSVYMSMYGTKGSYEEHANGKVWTGLDLNELRDLSKELACKPIKSKNTDLHTALQQDFFEGYSSVHPVERLPEEFLTLDNGHSGSHQFLVDDFVKAVYNQVLPPNHVWAAAKYCAPGLIAHQSALKEGEVMQIPNFG